MGKVKSLMVVLVILMLVGCASPMQMAVNKDTQALDLKTDALLLLTTDLKNEFKPSFQPEPTILHVEEVNGDKAYNFLMDREGHAASANTYIFRANLKPGKYVVRGISGKAFSFPIYGSFFLPLHSEIEVTENNVFYLGRVVGNVRERQEDEFRAGLIIPLVDQAIAGFSTGTFDISIVDNSQKDIELMSDLYPVLKNAEIKVALLPPFDRAYAQKWWADH